MTSPLASILLLALAAAEPSATAAVAPAPGVARDPPPLVVHATAIPVADLRRELGRRWPELVIFDRDGFVEVDGEPFVYVEILGETIGEAPLSVTLIVSDGRAYVRQVTPGEDRARAVALVVGNLLEAILTEDVPPDFSAQIPGRIARPTPPPIRRVARPQPAPAPSPAPAPTPTPVVVREPPPRWRIGVQAHAQLVLGLVPSRRGTPTFGGGSSALARAPRGLSFGVAARWTTAEASGYRLLRTRVSALVGWTGIAGELEWSALVGPSVEPFAVSRGGDRRALAGLSGRSVLFGAAAIAAVGYRVRLPGPQPTSLRVGIHFELASSVLDSGGAAQVLVREAAGDRLLFGAGGLEAALGADLTVWFDLGRPRPR